MNRTAPSQPGRLGAALLGALIPLAGYASPGACFVNCVDDQCTLGGEKFPGNSPRKVDFCDRARLDDGRAVVSFRSHGKAAQVIAVGAVDLKTPLAKYLPIDCLSLQKNDKCPTALRSSPIVLGKQFEDKDPWQPAGDPCGLGLPCGMVALGSAGVPWAASLSSPAAEGALKVWATRGQAADITVPVAAGRFELPPGWLRAGETFRYRLADPAGRVLAAGDFATLASTAQRDTDQFLAAARRAPAADRLNAVIRSLLDDGLDWDALQWSLGARGRP